MNNIKPRRFKVAAESSKGFVLGQTTEKISPDLRFGSGVDMQQCQSNVHFTLKADIDRWDQEVRLVPEADIAGRGQYSITLNRIGILELG
jgi:hypothetical protein